MLTIQSHSHPYTVTEAASLRAALEPHLASLGKTFFLVDQKVAELHGLKELLPADRTHLVEASEQAKSYEQLTPIFCWLLDAKCQRSSHLVVIGGGVLQDIGCFIASVLMRGIRWTLVPTTLLAQCDSCIGSKSSLNINRFKNQLGTFYPPHEVVLVFDVLETLTRDEILSGLGEAIKLHLIDGPESYDTIKQQLATARFEQIPLSEIVWSSLRIKQRYIEQDEFDRGVRNLLNYGHTFAHAFESATRYGIPHGIAVTMGVACATCFSGELGMAERGECEALIEWLEPYFGGYLETLVRVDRAAVLSGMKQDKKNVGNQITFILTRGPGKMEKTPLEAARAAQLLNDCLDHLCVLKAKGLAA
jgi:3-dehydroquinate synthase